MYFFVEKTEKKIMKITIYFWQIYLFYKVIAEFAQEGNGPLNKVVFYKSGFATCTCILVLID